MIGAHGLRDKMHPMGGRLALKYTCNQIGRGVGGCLPTTTSTLYK